MSSNAMWGGGGGGGGYYTVGNNAMYIQFKGVKGLVTVVLRKFSDLQGGATDLQGGANAPP